MRHPPERAKNGSRLLESQWNLRLRCRGGQRRTARAILRLGLALDNRFHVHRQTFLTRNRSRGRGRDAGSSMIREQRVLPGSIWRVVIPVYPTWLRFAK